MIKSALRRAEEVSFRAFLRRTRGFEVGRYFVFTLSRVQCWMLKIFFFINRFYSLLSGRCINNIHLSPATLNIYSEFIYTFFRLSTYNVTNNQTEYNLLIIQYLLIILVLGLNISSIIVTSYYSREREISLN